jgi:anti-sigma factor RsiW
MVQPQGVSPTAFARDALAAHVLFVSEKRHPVEVPAAQEAHLVAWLSKRLDTPIQAPDLQSQGFSLLGGRLLPGGDAPLAQLMYESKAGERLTLTVKHAAQRTDQTGFGILEKNGTSVFYWIDQRYGYALSGNIGKPRLLAIAQAVEGQLKHR